MMREIMRISTTMKDRIKVSALSSMIYFHSWRIPICFVFAVPDRGCLDENEDEGFPLSEQPDVTPPIAGQGRQSSSGAPSVVLNDIKLAHAFIDGIKAATLNNGRLDKDSIEHLQNPKPWTPSFASKEEQLSVELFVALGKSSQDTYNKVKDSIMHCFPGNGIIIALSG